MSIWANSPFCPVLFLILARLFWNQILIWFSFKPNSVARFRLRSSVRYRLSSNSFFNRANCSAEKAVRGRFSKLLDSLLAEGVEPGSRGGFLMRRDRGPVKSWEWERFYGLWHLTRSISSTLNLYTHIKFSRHGNSFVFSSMVRWPGPLLTTNGDSPNLNFRTTPRI